MTGSDVTAIIPTYRRRDSLMQALPNHLALRGIAEIVIVDDGSDDGTYDALLAQADARLRVIRHPENRGLPAARNTGAAAARTDWVVFLEDDCGFPEDYVEVLHRTALDVAADVVGAPWTYEPEQRNRATRGDPAPQQRLLTPPWVFPPTAVETPFMPALALVRRSVFARVGFDEGYRGNFYREETDFYVSARRAGFRVMLTPETSSWQLARFGGGCKGRLRLRDDFWAIRNTGRLLAKHGSYLRREGLLGQRPAVILWLTAWPRLRYYFGRPLRAPGWAWRRRPASFFR